MASAFSAKPTSARTARAAPSKPLSPTALLRPSKPRARNSGSATSTFSSAVNSSNSVMIWKERASPRAAILCGDKPVTSSPAMRTEPRAGFTRPVRTLKKVVLPAPFGPMMPCNSPGSTANEMSSSTTRSPKRTWMSRASSIAIALTPQHLREAGRAAHALRVEAFPPRLHRAGDALRPEQHDRDEEEPEPQHPGVRHRADDVAGDEIDDDADHRPPEAHHAAADQHHHDDDAGVVQAHDVREGGVLGHGEEAAGKARERGRDREHRHLVEPHRIAEVRGPRLALADRREHPAEGRMGQPPQANDRRHEHHEDKIVERGVARQVEGGEAVRLDRHEPEDLAEGDGHEGVIDAAPVRDEGRHERAGDAAREKSGREA